MASESPRRCKKLRRPYVSRSPIRAKGARRIALGTRRYRAAATRRSPEVGEFKTDGGEADGFGPRRHPARWLYRSRARSCFARPRHQGDRRHVRFPYAGDAPKLCRIIEHRPIRRGRQPDAHHINAPAIVRERKARNAATAGEWQQLRGIADVVLTHPIASPRDLKQCGPEHRSGE